MHTDNSTEALPETTYREHYTENTDKDFILSNKEKKTLPKNGKGSKTSAPNNINILDMNNIPSRTTEQKEVYRKQKQKIVLRNTGTKMYRRFCTMSLIHCMVNRGIFWKIMTFV